MGLLRCWSPGEGIDKHSLLILCAVPSWATAYMIVWWQNWSQPNTGILDARAFSALFSHYFLLNKSQPCIRGGFGMLGSRAGLQVCVRGKEGHDNPHSGTEHGRPRVLIVKSVRSACPLSFSVCPAWNFCLILRWREKAVINTAQYRPCPLVLRESFTASLLQVM